MFQSLTRPYFFHGSPAVLPYCLNSYAGQYGIQYGRRQIAHRLNVD